jgi:hypothetical protein
VTLTQPVPHPGWMYPSCLPVQIGNSTLCHGSVWTSEPPHVLLCRPVPLHVNGSILLGAGKGDKGTAYGATAFIFLYQIFYGVGLLPVPWFYPSEINTTRIRTRMQSIASAWNWMFVFIIVKITPISFANIGWRTFIIYTVLNFAFVPTIYSFYPETKGLELEDIPLLFEK